MLCDVCGRDNADNLTFCQDCGRRLQTARVASPTPPNGMPKVDAAPAKDALEQDARKAETNPPARRSRPEAPVFSFAPVEAKPTSPQKAVCPSCNADNPPEYRFCVTCGAPLREVPTAARGSAPDAPVPLPAVLMPELATSDPPGPSREEPPQTTAEPAVAHARLAKQIAAANEAPIVGAPVVGIATGDAPPPKMITCARCSGSCAPGTRFCKFCGAPLDDERPRRQPATTSPATPSAKAHDPPLDRTLVDPEPPTHAVPALQPLTVRDRPENKPTRDDVPARHRRASRATLVVIVEDGTEGRRFDLAGTQTDVGRAEGDIVLDDDPYVSPRHVRFLFENGKVRLVDLGSTNKVYLRIRKPEPLQDGDLLLLGLEVLQFQTVSDAERGLGHAMQHGTSLFGSPAATRRARLCQRTVEGITRDVYHLFRDETVIGRETGDIVFTADPFLSRRHAVVRRNPVTNEFVLQDLESSNGTFLAVRGAADLVNGDSVRVGQHLFRLDLDGDDSEANGGQGS